MKGTMLVFAALCLILCWTLPVGSRKISFIINLPKANPSIQMSMVEDAVDDMYCDCKDKMMKRVKNEYFKKENTGTFAKVWKIEENCSKDRLKRKDKEDKALTKDHMRAICVYTSDYESFYETFNAAVRTNRTVYNTSFPFHSLHFWLTFALQILNNNKKCHTTYRRSKAEFTGDVKQIIRFGIFASSSYKTTLTMFGKKTCFKIKTCFGAYLKHYPHLGKVEQEVLIPPYEKFKITEKIKDKSVEGLEDCEVVYILKSAGVQSNVDCRAA
ncbi:erythroblast NAD(P)(+)--arginine ADP-ribosyltransferase-like [Sebastes umbrosus]|uniref:erythroblast NAD(P)(+)--arginine ADP-ribosyltransferase-like n=1 Tax=Sebastes umbrosus TaxID=72105 RepID=UPI00189C72C1|nr:erythroblast NAD(P)(+)--arginine ADP-ribosyltransferase-like [Sebastes umbrosus]XP_037620299.1 erythroblast NAD(P)(+)--arginine ADP-ribosyltransferase-like [Sebastes umbrosus]